MEGDYGLPIVLVDPDGNEYNTSANDPTKELVGQVNYHSIDDNVNNNITSGDPGGSLVIMKPVVSIRKTSLTRVPVAGEIWES
jgi:hypothetical protein